MGSITSPLVRFTLKIKCNKIDAFTCIEVKNRFDLGREKFD